MTNVVATIRSSFSPLRELNFRIYLGGQTVSMIGTWLQSTAQSWVVWKLTDSEASLGIVNALALLPLLILGPWTGVWADRLDRRKLLMATQFAAMLLAFALAFLVQTEMVQLWHVYALALGLGIVTALDLPAQQAFLGDLAGMGEVRKAVNLNAMMLQVSRIIGPAIAGFLIAKIGIAPAFWLNGLSFLAVILSLWAVTANQVRATIHAGNPIQQMMEGVRYIRTQPRLQDLFVFSALTTFFAISIVMNLLPVVADKVLHSGADTYGLLMSSSGMGALVGVLFVVPLAQAQKRSGVVMGIAGIWLSCSFMVMGLTSSLPLTMLCLFAAGLGAPTIMTMALGLTQLMSPPDMRARLISLFSMISFGMQPIAALGTGLIAENFGVQRAIQVNATLLFIGVVVLLVSRPGFRAWEVKSAPRPEPVAVLEH